MEKPHKERRPREKKKSLGLKNVAIDEISENHSNLSSSTFDIPIFTEQFLDHNRSREAELRQLRKLNTEYEEQNAILSKHIERMKSAIDKLELELSQLKNENTALNEHLIKLKELILESFKGIAVPGTQEVPSSENIESYLQKMTNKLTKEKCLNKESEFVLEKVKNIVSAMEGSC